MGARQLQYLLEQGRYGYHALFELELIKRAMSASPVAAVEDDDAMMATVTSVARELSELGDVVAQRRYIERLPEDQQNLIVHLYFRFLDDFIRNQTPTIH